MIPTREQAWDLLCEYNEGEFHRLHARIVGDVMRYFAAQLGYADEADFWQTVGILHDLDFEQYPDQHCTKEAEILREKGVDERLVHAVVSHGYLLTVDVQPEHQMEKVLYATDELTGLIGAVVRMLPTKSVQDLQLKSLKKTHFTLEELAAEHAISLSSLKNCFRDIYGQTPYAYLKQYRIQRAAKLLCEGGHSIGWIANHVGYGATGKFAAAFKSIMGCPPSEYRKTHSPIGM